VSEFTAEWLALREPADWRARSKRVTQTVARALPHDGIRAVDLGAGPGSNARFLASALPMPQDWLLVDGNPALLEYANRRIGFAARVRVLDLSRLDALDEVFASCHLVTAAALLDLVSDQWLTALCALCRAHRTAVLFALTYDGRIHCSPPDAEDERLRTLVNRHQRTDKGIGRALGPDAAAHAAEHLEASGYQVTRDRSDWILESDSADLQRELIVGWVAAAAEVAPEYVEIMGRWLARRLFHIAEGRLRIVVGHEDVGAFMA